MADPESAIMPNMEGGYAPNYNPMAAVDGASGMIVDADVLHEMSEGESVIPTMERVEAAFGRKPEPFLVDSIRRGGRRAVIFPRWRRGVDRRTGRCRSRL